MTTTTTTLAAGPGPAPAEHARSGSAARAHAPLRDIGTMSRREARRTLRSVDSLITSFVMPVIVMLVFVVIFGGAIQQDGGYIDYVVPGVLIMCLGMGSATAAIAVAEDMTSGTINRFKTLPIFGPSTLWGHVIASVVRNLASAVVVIAAALALGFRPGAGLGDWVAFVGFAVLAVLAFTWLSAALGLLLSVEAAGQVNFIFLFVPYVSSGFVPVETMPEWLHGFAQHQPFTPIIESVRGLLSGAPDGRTVLTASAWLVGVLVVSVVVGGALYRRRTSR